MKSIFIVIFYLISLRVGHTQENLATELDYFGGESKTNIRNIQELRDPFRRPMVKSRQKKIQRGPRTSFIENVPSIQGVPLSLVRVVGVLLGEDRRAVAKIASGAISGEQEVEQLEAETYILKEGMKIGENQAEIKAILPGGIVLVEKIRNIYDQDEYLETIIPLTLQ